jgi:glucosamine-6-phosphate deaminase
MEIIICEDKFELGIKAAKHGASVIKDAILKNGRANIIFATGASQFQMLENLLKQDIEWNRVTGFHLDEYIGLPITHPASFRLYLWKRFVSRLPIPLNNFYYINAEEQPEKQCRLLGEIIKKHIIDLAFVGVGENGHLAFNDPPCDIKTKQPYIIVKLDINCKKQQLREGWFKTFNEVPEKAISTSMHQILKSQNIICCVPDKRKAEAVEKCFSGPASVDAPASYLQTHKTTTVYLDRFSAGKLTPSGT